MVVTVQFDNIREQKRICLKLVRQPEIVLFTRIAPPSSVYIPPMRGDKEHSYTMRCDRMPFIDFMLIDLDYIRKRVKGKEIPVIRLFGKDKHGVSVVLNVIGFLPYFYTERTGNIEEQIRGNSVIRNWLVKATKDTRKSYYGTRSIELLRLEGRSPRDLPVIRELVKRYAPVHEADIPFLKRFLIDTGIRCLQILSCWVDACYEPSMTVPFGDLQISPISVNDFQYRLRILSFDIEVGADQETIHDLLAKRDRRVIAISICVGEESEDFKSEVEILADDSDESEKQLISWFSQRVHDLDPDVLVSFNGDLFDFPYLIERMRRLDIGTHLFSVPRLISDRIYHSEALRTFRIKGRMVTDLYYKTWWLHPVSGKKGLGDIAQLKLGITKEEAPTSFLRLWEEARLDETSRSHEELVKYSRRDAELTYRLYWGLGLSEWVDALRLTGMPAGEGINSTSRNLGEFALFRVCFGKKVLIPALPSYEEVQARKQLKIEEPHKGGAVLEPLHGFYQDVLIADFRSMYPSIICAYNIGGETFRLDPSKKPGDQFAEHPRSSLAAFMDEMLESRSKAKAEYKKAMRDTQSDPKQVTSLRRRQFSLKMVLNSLFGAHNYPRGRFFNGPISNAVTEIGRNYLAWLQEQVSSFDPRYTMVYGDTDSAFVCFQHKAIPEISAAYEHTNESIKAKMREIALSRTMELIDYLNDRLPSPMELELEDIAYRVAFKPGRRKSYSFVSSLDGKIHIKGFEAVRSNWSEFAQEVQRNVLTAVLTTPRGGHQLAKTLLLQAVREIWTTKSRLLIPRIIVRSPVRKSPSDYKSPPPVLGAYLDYCERKCLDPDEEWKDFDRFPWIVTKGRGTLSKRARHPQYAVNIDREHYIDQITRAAERFGVKLSEEEKQRPGHMSGPLDKFIIPSPLVS